MYNKRETLRYWELTNGQSLTLFMQGKRANQKANAWIIDVSAKLQDGSMKEYTIWLNFTKKNGEKSKQSFFMWKNFEQIPDGMWFKFSCEQPTSYDGTLGYKKFKMEPLQGQQMPQQPTQQPQQMPIQQPQAQPITQPQGATVQDALDILGGQEVGSPQPPVQQSVGSEEQSMGEMIQQINNISTSQDLMAVKQFVVGLTMQDHNKVQVYETFINKFYQIFEARLNQVQNQ